jgi:hypothetical protein
MGCVNVSVLSRLLIPTRVDICIHTHTHTHDPTYTAQETQRRYKCNTSVCYRKLRTADDDDDDDDGGQWRLRD